jgi:NADPH2:quinone reductase
MGRCAGAFADYALMDAARGMPKPAALSWEQAASVPLTFLVVYDMLVTAGPAEGRRVAAGDRRVIGVGVWRRCSWARLSAPG